MARDYSVHTNHHNQRSFNGARGESEHSGCEEHSRHFSSHHNSKVVRGGGNGGVVIVGSEDEEGGGCHLKKTRRRRTGNLIECNFDT